MPLTPNFTVSSNITTPSILTLVDTSTGSDVAITQRRVYLQQFDGTYVVPTGTTTDYIEWLFASSTTSINAMDKDYSFNIIVQWLNVSNTVLYTKTIATEFNSYARIYRLKLLKAISANPKLVNNQNYFDVISQLTVFIDGANEAISLASDVVLAQLCNDNAKYLIDNPKLVY